MRTPDVRRMAREMCLRGKPWLSLSLGETTDPWLVELVTTPCRFGGSRPWFYCSTCGRKKLVLYWQPDRLRPECRRCLRLTYRSQRASRDVLTTGQLRIQALWRRISPDWHYGDEEPSKPPRMRWRTWERLNEAVGSWEAWINEQWLPRVVARLSR